MFVKFKNSVPHERAMGTGWEQKTWTKTSIVVICTEIVSTFHRVPTANLSKTIKSTFFMMFLLSILVNTV